MFLYALSPFYSEILGNLHIFLEKSSNGVLPPQVHHRLKRFSVAYFTFIRIATLAGLSGMPAMNPYRNHPGSSNK